MCNRCIHDLVTLQQAHDVDYSGLSIGICTECRRKVDVITIVFAGRQQVVRVPEYRSYSALAGG